jgi:hypothetical protein
MTEEYCKKASQEELIFLFNQISKSLVKQYKIKTKSSFTELNTKFANKKQHDRFYAKSYNDHRIYYKSLEDLQIIIKYLI